MYIPKSSATENSSRRLLSSLLPLQAERRRQKISVVNIQNAIFIVYEYYRMTFMYLAKYSTVPSVFVRTACT